MKKMILPLLISLVVGVLLAKFMLNQYERKVPTKPVLGSTVETVYFFQQGVYSTEENMKKGMTNFPYYVYQLVEGKYYVYIGITKVSENVSKLEGYFKNLGYDTYVKERKISDSTFLSSLEQYDNLLKETTDTKSIGTIVSQVLSKYEEGHQN